MKRRDYYGTDATASIVHENGLYRLTVCVGNDVTRTLHETMSDAAEKMHGYGVGFVRQHR